ncbi:DUF4426 domain-containing protein [Thaumasiovibrio sp. DFM-14]|uniref:DUF4426 domain-containing protein n=1 Tax=Thaumasiovibrio sp. DFM-14 TaxID=3384792 RepID=UPI0039A16E22
MKILLTLFLSLLLSLSASVSAEQSVTFDHIEVHYSAIPTTFLSPDIASNYRIQRSRYSALLNIAILDRTQDNQAMIASVHGSAANLLGNKKTLSFREIREGSAIYYLAEVPHTHEEQYLFEILITTQGGVTNTLRFRQTFYSEE